MFDESMISLKCVFAKFHKAAIHDFNENGTNILTCSRYLHFKSEIVEFFGSCDVVLILSGASLNSIFSFRGKKCRHPYGECRSSHRECLWRSYPL